jgi:hypothetical protein
MQTNQLKYLFEKISVLSKMEHDEIFKIIKEKTTYSKNKNGIFFNLSNLDKSTIIEIENFVKYCISNKQDLDDYDKKINECKLNNNYNNIMNISNIDEEINKKPIEDWNEIVNDAKCLQKISSFIDKIMLDKDKIGKKKVNVKFNNAKKRYAKKINTQNLSLEDMPELEKEDYKVI